MPNPAIVSQHAARRLPRWALPVLCMLYVVVGFVGRDPWKNADMAAFGYFWELSEHPDLWLAPQLMGLPDPSGALLPYWLGALGLAWAPDWLGTHLGARLPFMALLAVSFAATWYAAFHLAKLPEAQPVSFAFGGEAAPVDYARALADGALLALLACLGLAQLSHETTPALTQMCGLSLLIYGFAGLRHQRRAAWIGLALGWWCLSLSGAPVMAWVLGLLGCLWLSLSTQTTRQAWVPGMLLIAGVNLGLHQLLTGSELAWWQPAPFYQSLRRHVQLLTWFTWPAWPLALWTLWRWRGRWTEPHLLLVLSFWAVVVLGSYGMVSSDRALLTGLPALAVLAAFALPTLKRAVAALVDWFTLLFFSACGFTIWVIWIAMETGVPRQPAYNVAKLAPGFVPSWDAWSLGAAVVASLSWAGLVRWRTGRHQPALWTSLVLPAGGATLCWVLLMTLWLPLLDYARSYRPMVTQMRSLATPMDTPCLAVYGLSRAQLAAFRVQGGWQLRPLSQSQDCGWLLVETLAQPPVAEETLADAWTLHSRLKRPTDKNEIILVYQRTAVAARP